MKGGGSMMYALWDGDEVELIAEQTKKIMDELSKCSSLKEFFEILEKVKIEYSDLKNLGIDNFTREDMMVLVDDEGFVPQRCEFRRLLLQRIANVEGCIENFNCLHCKIFFDDCIWTDIECGECNKCVRQNLCLAYSL